MSRVLKLNVGGKHFETTPKTLECCQAIPFDDDGVLDHDPDVFARTLKVLRGYPCEWALHDDEVLCELSMLDHDMMRVEIPQYELNFEDISIHTLDADQAQRYHRTHVLIPKKVLQDATKYEECRVVAAEAEWEDRCWVPRREWNIMKLKLLFTRYFLDGEKN